MLSRPAAPVFSRRGQLELIAGSVAELDHSERYLLVMENTLSEALWVSVHPPTSVVAPALLFS